MCTVKISFTYSLRTGTARYNVEYNRPCMYILDTLSRVVKYTRRGISIHSIGTLPNQSRVYFVVFIRIPFRVHILYTYEISCVRAYALRRTTVAATERARHGGSGSGRIRRAYIKGFSCYRKRNFHYYSTNDDTSALICSYISRAREITYDTCAEIRWLRGAKLVVDRRRREYVSPRLYDWRDVLRVQFIRQHFAFYVQN